MSFDTSKVQQQSQPPQSLSLPPPPRTTSCVAAVSDTKSNIDGDDDDDDDTEETTSNSDNDDDDEGCLNDDNRDTGTSSGPPPPQQQQQELPGVMDDDDDDGNIINTIVRHHTGGMTTIYIVLCVAFLMVVNSSLLLLQYHTTSTTTTRMTKTTMTSASGGDIRTATTTFFVESSSNRTTILTTTVPSPSHPHDRFLAVTTTSWRRRRRMIPILDSESRQQQQCSSSSSSEVMTMSTTNMPMMMMQMNDTHSNPTTRNSNDDDDDDGDGDDTANTFGTTSSTTSMTIMTTTASSSSVTTATPVRIVVAPWHSSMELNVSLITNLIHAALLVVVAILVLLRGDVVWMFFVYHTTFFWMIISMCYLASGGMTTLLRMVTDIDDTDSTDESTATSSVSVFTVLQYCSMFVFAMGSMMIWLRYCPAYTSILQQSMTSTTSNTTDGTDNNNNRCSRRTVVAAQRVLLYGCRVLQYSLICYYCITTIQYIVLQWKNHSNYYSEYHFGTNCNTNETNDGDDNNNTQYRGDDRFLHDVSDHNDEMMILNNVNTSSSSSSSLSSSNASSTSNVIAAYVMTYSEVAHVTFVLSMIQLSIVYPYCNTCCMGTMIVSLWKLVLNSISLYQLIVSASRSGSGDMVLWTIRTKCSFVYTTLDILTMIPILTASFYLYYCNDTNTASNDISSSSSSIWSLNALGVYFCRRRGRRHGHGKFTRLNTSTNNNTDRAAVTTTTMMGDDTDIVEVRPNAGVCGENYCSEVEDGIMKVIDGEEEVGASKRETSQQQYISTFECRTTFQIASSSRILYSSRQQFGATLLSHGSLLLFITMTLESILLQSQSFLYTNNAKYDIYKWGLHVCVMYTFCTVMSISVGNVYYQQYSRPILLLACPTGSIIAAYQVYNLFQLSKNDNTIDIDILSIIALVLFMTRCICGIVQTLGVYCLKTIQPMHLHPKQQSSLSSSLSSRINNGHMLISNVSEHCEENSGNIIDVGMLTIAMKEGVIVVRNNKESSTLEQEQQQDILLKILSRIHVVLYTIYIPILIVCIVLSVAAKNTNCFVEPMISPMIPSVSHNNNKQSTCSDSDNHSPNDDMEFMLMSNIPGLGLYFHFGIVLLLFTYDGIQRAVPTYPPSLFLAMIGLYQFGIVLGSDVLLWDIVQTRFYTTDIQLSNIDVLQRVVQIMWSISAGYLGYQIHLLWNYRRTGTGIAVHSVSNNNRRYTTP